MIKNPSERKKVSLAAAEKLANALADKTYGEEKKDLDEIVRTSISLPKLQLQTIEDIANVNKRNGKGPKNCSAIVRIALEMYLKSLK